MSFDDLVQQAIQDTVGPSLWAIRPELVLCATIVWVLVWRMVAPGRSVQPSVWMMVGGLIALGLAAPWDYLGQSGRMDPVPIFGGLLVHDTFSIYVRSLVLLFTVFLAALVSATGEARLDRGTEFCVLVLGAALGMCLMASANHMVMVFLAFEMASVPSYVLVGLRKSHRCGSEGALKMAVFGGAAAGVMLYGISLLCGLLGSAHLPTMGRQVQELLLEPAASPKTMLLVLAGLMLLVGLAFKISAVPFHFWAPDAFEGATAEVGALLAVASKAAALALLVRVATVLCQAVPAQQWAGGLIGLLAALSCTFGNLAAYGQTNIKRLLAYSTIAHAGYLMMPVAAALVLASANAELARAALASLGFYLGVYVFMNLGAFALAAFLRDATGSEQIAAYAGLMRRSPGVTICFALILFSLVGLPPLAGFAAKFVIFKALADAGLWVLLAIGALNTVLSLFYYVGIVRVMVLQAEAPQQPAPTIPLLSPAGLYALAMTFPLLFLGVWWEPLFAWARAASSTLAP